ncbi:Tumor protein D52 [Collichthys lucidus]|uniref:Tumor protein D52 n=1 Tax=Collichthys lucidus TaxID=240159 RepID=A0A4U5VJ68_COLLU|nr:Tumor protein D52 [Collichthys lucidus]
MEPLEEYHSPFDFEQGVNASYLYLSPAYSDTPPSSPAVKTRGNHKEERELGAGCQQPDPVPEMGEDAVTSVNPSPPVQSLSEEERQELQEELFKVLAAKEKQLADIKRKLGITPLNELKQNITKTWQEVTTSTAYRRTSETLSQAGLKATAAFSNVGSAISKKLEDTKMSPPASSTNPDNQDAANPSTDTLSSQPEDLPTQEMPMN